MNITESTDVQTVLTWLLDSHTDDGEDQAKEAAARLADRAVAALGAGLHGYEVRLLWPDMLTACPGCQTCAPTTGGMP